MFKKLDHSIVYFVLIIALGFGIRHFFLDTEIENGGNQSTQALFAATFPDETGQPQALKNYAGKIVVLNFWATWCEPCREEMPELSKLHSTYQNRNLVVLGVAVDDIAAISAFVKETKVNYPLFAADMQGMEIATHLGNNKGVLPYTVIIKTDGSVAKTYFGRVTQQLLEKTLETLL
ncbi:MAG: TlpA disulfide reductase family protein [Methylotenera sp.]